MPSSAKKPCSKCGKPARYRGLCSKHSKQADTNRGTSTQRGYGRTHRDTFREAVLERHPICQWPAGCSSPATDADHHPQSRRQLIAAGLNPDDPQYGRGLCHAHHSTHTAQTQSHLGKQG